MFLHACVHVCVQCIDLCVHAGARAIVCCGVRHVMTRGKWLVSPSKRSLYFLSLLLSVNLRLADLARHTDQCISMICLSLLPSGGVAHAMVFRFYVGAGDTNQFFMSTLPNEPSPQPIALFLMIHINVMYVIPEALILRN